MPSKRVSTFTLWFLQLLDVAFLLLDALLSLLQQVFDLDPCGCSSMRVFLVIAFSNSVHCFDKVKTLREASV